MQNVFDSNPPPYNITLRYDLIAASTLEASPGIYLPNRLFSNQAARNRVAWRTGEIHEPSQNRHSGAAHTRGAHDDRTGGNSPQGARGCHPQVTRAWLC